MSGDHGSGGLDDLFEVAGEHSGEHRALIVLGVAGLALALILAAFFVGRGFAQSGEQAGAAPATGGGGGSDTLAEAAVGGEPRASTRHDPGRAPSATPSSTSAGAAPDGRLLGRPFHGPVTPATVLGAHASCRAEPSVDSAGSRVRYPASNMLDGTHSTAWRCAGTGRGVTLTFNLPQPRRIAQVGLVPGYAKTDAFSGADRYAQNRRIARVRWAFDGGEWVEQAFRTRPGYRDLQTMRIPAVRTRRVTVTIEQSVPGRRDNTVAVSAVRLAGPRH
jgi:hypothetical protein